MQRTLTLTGKNPRPPELINSFRLKVTPEIIKTSIPGDQRRCMVSAAVKQQFPTAQYIWSDVERISFTFEGSRYSFLPPPKVIDHIAAFDQHRPIKPFSCTIDQLQKLTYGGTGAFSKTHPKGDNRTNPNKRYYPKFKRRKYGTLCRIDGVSCRMPV